MNIFELPVHPDAAIFPEYPQEKMDNLVGSIKELGQLNPIKIGEIDGVMHLIDGRHRRKACEVAGVDPVVVILNGEDYKQVILAENTINHELTKGQIAMYHALITEKEKGGRGNKSLSNGKSLSHKLISQAHTIIEHLPEDVEGVRLGEIPFSKAYSDAMEAKQSAADLKEKRDRENAENAARKTTLEAEDPIKYQQVVDDVLSLDQAWAVFEVEQKSNRADELNKLITICIFFKRGLESVSGLHGVESLKEILEAENDKIMAEEIKAYFPDSIATMIKEHAEGFINHARELADYKESNV